MAKIYYEKDANLALLKNKVIGIIGYGSQGHAHAQNLRDSGLKVIVAEAKGTEGYKAAKKAGFDVSDAGDVAKRADIIMMLVPDQLQAKVYKESIADKLTKGKTLMFAHGFNIHYGQIVPPDYVDVTMIAPKCPGHMVRQLLLRENRPAGHHRRLPGRLGQGQGAGAGLCQGHRMRQGRRHRDHLQEETETDLFGEQAVLCGGVTALIKAGFETLVEAGYQPEIAYFECLHELKLIVDLIYRGGMTFMRYSVSDTAEYGDYTRGPQIINDSVQGRDGRRYWKRFRTAVLPGSGSWRTRPTARSTMRSSAARPSTRLRRWARSCAP